MRLGDSFDMNRNYGRYADEPREPSPEEEAEYEHAYLDRLVDVVDDGWFDTDEEF